ncbi:MAG: hypothetical protein ACTSQD_00700, partial [Promethearchaeota archaeon]
LKVKKFVDYYLSFEEKGVKIIPAINNENDMNEILKETLKNRNISHIYISFDVDVCVFKEVLAARFMNVIGVKKELILSAANMIKNFMVSNNCQLIGLDFLEIDTYVLGRELKKSGRKDRTVEVIDEFLKIII